MSPSFPVGARVRLPGTSRFSIIDNALARPDGWVFYLVDEEGAFSKHEVSHAQAEAIELLVPDGKADGARVLACLWCGWMRAATSAAKATARASSPLLPYAHQSIAVYERMLPQPFLRFLLADEPGTGKTIMAGLYLRERQRLGLLRRALVVAPAHLVSKWQADFERFFAGGLRRITGTTIQEGVLSLPHDLWIVSLELAAQNPAVQEAIRPDRAGWDCVVFDEAHRLTPSAKGLYRVGKLLATSTPSALLMTATPHRGKDDLFRSLLHLVDGDVYAAPSTNPPGANAPAGPLLQPGRLHFLRRMKEDLVDRDGHTPLFKGRTASNESVPLNPTEAAFYNEAQELVARFFPASAQTLARMVYGKRAASSLFALCETLKRRKKFMGSELPASALQVLDPEDEDPSAQEETRVIYEASQASVAERERLGDLIKRLEKELANPASLASKWPQLLDQCFAPHGIEAGNGEQAVVFSEFADSATWLVERLKRAGFSARRYSGADSHPKRDEIRAAFTRREFQILVSTDAGNEGIDLQSAHVLVNWDIPWSLVRLEQRMGRIHRVGQTRDVWLFNLIALGTREGDVLNVLLGNLVVAANRLNGKIFDSLSLLATEMDVNWAKLLTQTFENGAPQALRAAQNAGADAIEETWRKHQQQELQLKSQVDVASAQGQWQQETLESINPRIVEAFLRRLAGAGLCTLKPHALGDGIFVLAQTDGELPPSLREHGSKTGRVNIATSGDALSLAQAISSSPIVALGPSEAAFRELVAHRDNELRPDIFRGAVLQDASATGDYDLFLWEMKTEQKNLPPTAWPVLVRVDENGARLVRWETLANLQVPTLAPENVAPMSEEGQLASQAIVEAARAQRLSEREATLASWLRDSQLGFRRLIDSQVAGLGREERIATRKRLEAASQKRLDDFGRATHIEISAPRCLGFAHVASLAQSLDPTKVDSEKTAMRFVVSLLQGEGFDVQDVHLEGRGFDLLASKAAQARCVEVKGVWGAASSAGVHLTGNEVLIAQQQAENYFLYVVQFCQNGKGELFGAFANPVALFGSSMRDISLFKVPGSALAGARQGSGAV